ncbi:MAG TPA: MmgE/PrpD family protein [Anaerolineae bacterium]|nr:MmgE/PrpD family protein [Anaerolineae bacterium]HOQ98016.1 MmgE/PrpD family protein [Anaerolineae bacterium]
MSWRRDLAWHNLDLVYRSSVAHQFARYALGLDFQALPPGVVHQGKRCILDALGCAIGAYQAPGRPMMEAFVQELAGPPEATLFGSGCRTSARNATLFNSFLVRFLDYNDIGGGGHNSDCISGILAVAEREKANGPAFLLSVVIAYELGDRVSTASTAPRGQGRGLDLDCRGGISMPPALGRLMGLDEVQIANAIGLCASHANPLKILDAHREENSMAKNLRFGWVAHDALLSCLMAKRGITGPVRVVEGEGGFGETAMQGKVGYERMVDVSGWRILNVRHKYIAANITTHGHVMATLAIVKENDLRPEDIAAVHIKAGLRESHHTTTLSKKYPRNAESADHSAYYANAIAIIDRSFDADSIEPARFTDPAVLDLIERITVEADPALPEFGFGGISEIVTRDGRRFQKRVDVPHGMGDDPLTDAELEDKFAKMATKYMPDRQIRQIFDAVWNLDELDSVNRLAALMAFEVQ